MPQFGGNFAGTKISLNKLLLETNYPIFCSGDRDLLQFLKEEIKYEEGNVIKIPKFKDFEVSYI